MTKMIEIAKSQEPADRRIAAKEAKREEQQEARKAKGEEHKKAYQQTLLGQIYPEFPEYECVNELEDLAEDDNSYIAILHADGNGLGKTVPRVMKALTETPGVNVSEAYREFSDAISRSTKQAVRAALDPIVRALTDEQKAKGLPFRLLVCAGDDLTIVLRAKDAMGFVEKFMDEFEKQSSNLLKTWMDKHAIGWLGLNGLTVCAGVAYVKKNYPFMQAYDLCESLVSYSKKKTGRIKSAVSFWRLTSFVAEDFSEIIEKELKVESNDGKKLVLTQMPYLLNAETGWPSLSQLITLKDAKGKMPRGSTRRILTDMARGEKILADQAYRRVLHVAKEKHETAARDFAGALSDLTGTTTVNEELWKKTETDVFSTPLHDAVELHAAEKV